MELDRIMRLNLHLLRIGECLDLAQQPSDGLHLLRGSGRGIQASVPAGWVSLWWPLSGQLSLSAFEGEWNLRPRHAQIWKESALRCRPVASSSWMALAGPAALWDPCPAEAQGADWLFPWQGRLRRHNAALLFALMRLAETSNTDDAERLFDALKTSLREEQQVLHALLPRCNGRTPARRRQTLMRLLRVRHRIQCHPDTRLDLESLARTASYSPCHLIRVFRAVFDETPSDYAARLREEQAWHMVIDTRLPICEITGMLGFESQSAFCRAFKNAFGKTTSEVRQAYSSQNDVGMEIESAAA